MFLDIYTTTITEDINISNIIKLIHTNSPYELACNILNAYYLSLTNTYIGIYSIYKFIAICGMSYNIFFKKKNESLFNYIILYIVCMYQNKDNSITFKKLLNTVWHNIHEFILDNKKKINYNNFLFLFNCYRFKITIHVHNSL